VMVGNPPKRRPFPWEGGLRRGSGRNGPGSASQKPRGRDFGLSSCKTLRAESWNADIIPKPVTCRIPSWSYSTIRGEVSHEAIPVVPCGGGGGGNIPFRRVPDARDAQGQDGPLGPEGVRPFHGPAHRGRRLRPGEGRPGGLPLRHVRLRGLLER